MQIFDSLGGVSVPLTPVFFKGRLYIQYYKNYKKVTITTQFSIATTSRDEGGRCEQGEYRDSWLW